MRSLSWLLLLVAPVATAVIALKLGRMLKPDQHFAGTRTASMKKYHHCGRVHIGPEMRIVGKTEPTVMYVKCLNCNEIMNEVEIEAYTKTNSVALGVMRSALEGARTK